MLIILRRGTLIVFLKSFMTKSSPLMATVFILMASLIKNADPTIQAREKIYFISSGGVGSNMPIQRPIVPKPKQAIHAIGNISLLALVEADDRFSIIFPLHNGAALDLPGEYITRSWSERLVGRK